MPLFPQRGPSQGSRLYTNADLNRRGPAAQDAIPADGGMLSNPPQRQPGDVPFEQLMAQARGSLGRANDLSASVDQGDDEFPIADEQAAEAYSAEAPSVMDSTGQGLSKSVMHYLKTRPEAISMAAPIDAMIPGPLGVPGRLVTGGQSVADLYDMGFSGAAQHPVRAGLDALGLMMGVGGARSTAKGVGNMVEKEGARRAAASAMPTVSKAGQASEARYMARGLDAAGHSKSQVQKLTGLGPRTPRSISSATPVSHNSTPISELMSGEDGAFRRPSAPMDALRRQTTLPETDYRVPESNIMDDMLRESGRHPEQFRQRDADANSAWRALQANILRGR